MFSAMAKVLTSLMMNPCAKVAAGELGMVRASATASDRNSRTGMDSRHICRAVLLTHTPSAIGHNPPRAPGRDLLHHAVRGREVGPGHVVASGVFTTGSNVPFGSGLDLDRTDHQCWVTIDRSFPMRRDSILANPLVH
jgi:hypothetical protein